VEGEARRIKQRREAIDGNITGRGRGIDKAGALSLRRAGIKPEREAEVLAAWKAKNAS